MELLQVQGEAARVLAFDLRSSLLSAENTQFLLLLLLLLHIRQQKSRALLVIFQICKCTVIQQWGSLLICYQNTPTEWGALLHIK